MATYQGVASVGSISAMPVFIDYEASWGEFELSKRGEEYLFQFTLESKQVEEGNSTWRHSRLNADAILGNFQNAKTPTQALDFLNQTGQFSTLTSRFSWSYFQRWQRLAYLLQEHDLLESAMRSGLWEGEFGEVLKALAGNQENTFFEGFELDPIGARAMSEKHTRWFLDPQNAERVREEIRIMNEERAELCAWFRQPPDTACSVEWIPKNEDDYQTIFPLVANGAMAEFLLPQEAMRPVLFIQPTNTLEAIAAVIYADRISGVEYRACEVCSELFEVGSRDEKKYCSRERCKNTAHQRRMRANRAKARKAHVIPTEGEE